MTFEFDQYFNQIMENIDTLTASRLLNDYQNKIRKFSDRNYEADPVHVDRMRMMRQKAIQEYEEFIDKNREEIIKTGLQHKVLQFNRELRNMRMM